jgi:hypothetical protein
MGGTPEGRQLGGERTLELHGREHYARITKGRPRRPRFSDRRDAAEPGAAAAVNASPTPGGPPCSTSLKVPVDPRPEHGSTVALAGAAT